MLKIKVCGMTDVLNVREVAEAGPDFIGFIFYPDSKRYIGKDQDEIIFNQVPSGIIKTGVFVNESIYKIMKHVRHYKLDAIQLHGSESPDYCYFIKSKGLITIKAFGIGADFDYNHLTPYLTSCDYFLFDSKTENLGGSGTKFKWDKLNEYQHDKYFFLSGGIGPEDIHDLKTLRHNRLFGIDINSRFESSPGIKDIEKLKVFFREIKKQGYEL